jgi:hypothetical protein
MNEGTINVLGKYLALLLIYRLTTPKEHYFEMSRPDAERALNIYKTFGAQTAQVVQYLSVARQYESSTRLEVPKLKHAPTTLTSSLEDYLNDADFEINRRQYLAQQEAKRTGKPVASAPAPTPFDRPADSRQAAAPAPVFQPPPSQSKGPAPDLIDFFESIEQNQQPMAQFNNNAQQEYQQQQQFLLLQQQQQQQHQQQQLLLQQQQQQVPQQTGFNPFLQQQNTFQSAALPQAQPPALQTDFTGAGFGGYGPQPQQQPSLPFQFSSSLSPIPQNGVADFQSHALPTGQPNQLQPQHTSTNPFRQSMMPTGNSPSTLAGASPSRLSTNPFAKHNTGAVATNGPTGVVGYDQLSFSPVSPLPSNQPTFLTSPVQDPSQGLMFAQPPTLQPQRTGTNPFAKNRPTTAGGAINTNVTGSTNPFRQSAFVNQQTGQGWQHGNQGTFSGFDLNAVGTTPVFPRPGAQ